MNNTADILSVINDHGFDDTDTTTKLAFLNDTITDFCARHPWPFLESSLNLTFDGVSNVPTNLPTNMRAVTSMVDPNTTRVIQPERLDSIEKSAADMITQVSDPLFYYFQGGQLRFAPIPTASFTARMRFLQFHPVVTSDTDTTGYLVPNRHWMALIFGTLVKLYDMDDDPEMSTRFEQHYEKRINDIVEELFKQQYDRPDHVVVTDPDYLLDLPLPY